MSHTVQRWFWIGLALLSPIVPVQAYLGGSWEGVLHTYSLAMLFGIISFVYFANTLIMSARLGILDRLYGHDRVMVFHGRLAMVALACGIVHAILKYSYFGISGIQVALGIIATVLFFVVGLVTLLFMVGGPLQRVPGVAWVRKTCVQNRGFDYSRLKLFHNLTALAMTVLIIHVLMAAPTAETTTRLALTGAWGGISILVFLYHKVIRVMLRHRQSFDITEVHNPTDSIVRLRAERDGWSPRHRPGQFGYFRLMSRACGWEEHPFTIASAPHTNHIEILAKELGDYSARLKYVQPGDKLLFDGAYGVFTPTLNTQPTLFVAGGIGITPFLSILRSWNASEIRKPTTLVWTVRRRNELVDEGLFEQMASRHAQFTYVPLMTREPGVPAHHIDRELLTGLLNPEQLAETSVYICGPTGLRVAVQKILKDIGVARKHIHYEAFTD